MYTMTKSMCKTAARISLETTGQERTPKKKKKELILGKQRDSKQNKLKKLQKQIKVPNTSDLVSPLHFNSSSHDT